MIWSVVRTGWMNLRRDRAAWMLSFVVPIVFFSIFASIFGAQRRSTPRVSVVVVDEDHSQRSKRLVDALRAETALKIIDNTDARAAEATVKKGDAPVALLIPKGFGATQISFGPGGSNAPAFRLLRDPSDMIAEQVLSGLLQKTLFVGMPDMMITGGIDALERFGGPLTPQQRENLQKQTSNLQRMPRQTQRSGAGDIVKLNVIDVVGDLKKNPIIAFYGAGVGVMFLLFTASGAGGALLDEVESGTLDRILSTRVSMLKLLTGKLVYLWTLGVIQLVVMFVWGALVFGLPLMSHLLGFAIMTAATALTCAAFGLLLASATRTRAQLSAVSTLAVLTISALGGSMFPRFLMSEKLQKASLVLFNSWALDGFINVFWREAPLTSLAAPVAVLIAWAVVFFFAARQLTRRWESI
ncbi:MAG: ABC transporter permease [Acidobacteriota bacterium]|nr:ABC transporter permease [Acidobacteriota bacterium]